MINNMPDIREEKLRPNSCRLNAVHRLCGISTWVLLAQIAACRFVFTFAFRYFDCVF